MMRFYAKILLALLIACVLQLLVNAAGGWREITFEARCLVSLWNHDPVLHERLVEEGRRILAAEREAAIQRLSKRERAPSTQEVR